MSNKPEYEYLIKLPLLLDAIKANPNLLKETGREDFRELLKNLGFDEEDINKLLKDAELLYEAAIVEDRYW